MYIYYHFSLLSYILISQNSMLKDGFLFVYDKKNLILIENND